MLSLLMHGVGWGGGGDGQNSIITHPPLPTSTDYDTRFQKKDVHYTLDSCVRKIIVVVRNYFSWCE